MAEEITYSLLLGTKIFYPGEEADSKEAVARAIGKDVINDLCCFFLSFFNKNNFPEVPQLLRRWFTNYDVDFKISPSFHYLIGRYFQLVEKHPNWSFALLNVESLLRLFIWNNNAELPDNNGNVDAGLMTRFFNLYLLFNDDILNDYAKADVSSKQYKDYQTFRLLLAQSFPQHDFLNADFEVLLYSQLFKCIHLLDFVESSPSFNPILIKLLEDFGCKTKQDYLKAIGGAVILSIKNDREGWTELYVDKSIDATASQFFLDKLIIAEDDELVDENDYLQLRNKPFYRTREGNYRVIFDLFILKKLYNGLFFKFSEYCRENKGLFRGDFLGTVRDQFSEGVLVYSVLDSVFENYPKIAIKGDEFKKLGIPREPDYYCRVDNNIFLFESKDFYMQGRDKLSYDFAVLERELKVKDGRIGKAVKQLATNICRCRLKELPDQNYDAATVRIFPILIVHDSLYTAPSLNFWTNIWFQEQFEEVKKDEKYSKVNLDGVLPVTIVEIDMLIYFLTYFKNKQIELADLIMQYYQHIGFNETEKDFSKSPMSFSEILRHICGKMGLIPDLDAISALLKNYVD